MTDLLCFSHLRWDFVYQRPQHIMSRFSKVCRTFFIEEPLPIAENQGDYLEIKVDTHAPIFVVRPRLNDHQSATAEKRLAGLLTGLLGAFSINKYVSWYYSPIPLRYTEHLEPQLIVYDCMDELSAFKGADAEIPVLEQRLLERADLVFTGGNSLYNAKKNRHPRVYEFPSSIDKNHFAKARGNHPVPRDQAGIERPKFGFFGVLDERLDLDLLRQVSSLRPDWNFILIGPVVKIDVDSLPRANNLHYLGPKNYQELPAYLADWDIAFIPFALNESTRYISPTKTPEFLCGGKRVIATAIQDICNPYGNEGLVTIIKNADEFIEAGSILLHERDQDWLTRVDNFLKDKSWDDVFLKMYMLINDELQGDAFVEKQNATLYV